MISTILGCSVAAKLARGNSRPTNSSVLSIRVDTHPRHCCRKVRMEKPLLFLLRGTYNSPVPSSLIPLKPVLVSFWVWAPRAPGPSPGRLSAYRFLHLADHLYRQIAVRHDATGQHRTGGLLLFTDVRTTHGARLELPRDHLHLADAATSTPASHRNATPPETSHAGENGLPLIAAVGLTGVFDNHLILHRYPPTRYL